MTFWFFNLGHIFLKFRYFYSKSKFRGIQVMLKYLILSFSESRLQMGLQSWGNGLEFKFVKFLFPSTLHMVKIFIEWIRVCQHVVVTDDPNLKNKFQLCFVLNIIKNVPCLFSHNKVATVFQTGLILNFSKILKSVFLQLIIRLFCPKAKKK